MIRFDCTCERKSHAAPLEAYEISSGAIEKLPEILKDFKRIYVVCDEHTYLAAGKRVEALLKEAVSALNAFGEEADFFRNLADTVAHRDH